MSGRNALVRVLLALKPGNSRDVVEDTLASFGARFARAKTIDDIFEIAQVTGFDLIVADEAFCEDDLLHKLTRRQPGARVWLYTEDLATPALQRGADFLFLKPLDAVVLSAKFAKEYSRSRIKNSR